MTISNFACAGCGKRLRDDQKRCEECGTLKRLSDQVGAAASFPKGLAERAEREQDRADYDAQKARIAERDKIEREARKARVAERDRIEREARKARLNKMTS